MFCINCGAEMADDAAQCPKCGQQQGEGGDPVCSKCGEALDEGQQFCSKCGAKAGSQATPPPPPKSGISFGSDGKMIQPSDPPKNLVAATTLACICGLGQLYLGQTMKGIVMLIGGVLLTAVTAGALSPFLAIGSMLDAYFIGKKLEAGNAVGEWEFF